MAVILCDKDLKIVKILNVSDINMGFRGKYEFPFSAIGFQAYKERAYVAVGNDFTIDVFDKKGNKLYQIKKKHEPLPLTREYETKTVDSFKKNPNYMQFWPFIRNRLKYKSHFPAIQDLYVKNDRIYVITYKRKGEKTECVILDLQGNERKRVFIAYPVFYGLDFKLPFAFHDHNVYRLIDNEEKEVWELHKQKLE